jgi:hypothetical protein
VDEALINPSRTTVAELDVIVAVVARAVIEKQYCLAGRGVGDYSRMTVGMFADDNMSLNDGLLRDGRRHRQEGSGKRQRPHQHRPMKTPSRAPAADLLPEWSACR